MMRIKPKPKKDRETGADWLDAAWAQLGTANQSLRVAELKYQSAIKCNNISTIINDLIKIGQRIAHIM